MKKASNVNKLKNGKAFHLGYKLESSIGEERPNSQTDEVGEHFGEVGLFSDGNESQTQQWGQINDGNSQEAISPDFMQKERWKVKQLKLYRRVNHPHPPYYSI